MAKSKKQAKAPVINFQCLEYKDTDGIIDFFCSHGGMYFQNMDTESSDYVVAYSTQPFTEAQAKAEYEVDFGLDEEDA